MTLGAKDFKYAKVKVTVEHEGKPVASAIVTLKDAERTQKQLLSPDMNGAATFEQVHLGKVVASVEYKVSGTSKTAPELHAAVEPDRTDAVPTLAISIPDAVATVGSAEAPKAATGEAAPTPSGGGSGFGLGAIIITLLALGAGAGLPRSRPCRS